MQVSSAQRRRMWVIASLAALLSALLAMCALASASAQASPGDIQAGQIAPSVEAHTSASHDRVAMLDIQTSDEANRGADNLVWDDEKNAFVFGGYLGYYNSGVDICALADSEDEQVWLAYKMDTQGRVRWFIVQLRGDISKTFKPGGMPAAPFSDHRIIVGPEAPTVTGSSSNQSLNLPESASEYDLKFNHYPFLSKLSISTDGVGVTPALNSYDAGTESFNVKVVPTVQSIQVKPETAYTTDADGIVSWDVPGVEVDANGTATIPISWDADGKMTARMTLKDAEGTSSDRTITFDMERTNILFSAQPQSKSVSKISNITLTAQAKGDGAITYQWYENTEESSEGGVPIESATESTLVVAAPESIPAGGVRRFFYCVATATGDLGAVSCVSDAVHTGWYNLADLAPTVTIETADGQPVPQEGVTYSADEALATLIAKVSCPVADGDYTYVWVIGNRGLNTADGENELQSYRISPKDSADGEHSLTCKVIHTVDGLKSAAVTSDVSLKIVRSQAMPALVLKQPVSGVAEVGSQIQLSARVKPPSFAFRNQLAEWQWQISPDRRTWSDIDGASGSIDSGGNIPYFDMPAQATMPDLGRVWLRARITMVQTSVSGNVYRADTYTNAQTWDAASDWEGSGTSDDPYLISSQADLQLLSARVNSTKGLDYAGTYFKMTKNLTLPDGWEPVGSDQGGYAGFDFDGGGYLLTVPEGGLPLIGTPGGCTIHDLDIYGPKIDGYGLVNDIRVSRQYNVIATIRNVTLKSGTKTRASGFIGGWASGMDAVKILDCTAEEGVIIGYDKQQSNIGTFAGELNGTIANCVSHATVYGKDFVGGIVGDKGQTMGDFYVINCTFDGVVEATGNQVGGIVGAGYAGTLLGIGSAPNSPCASVRNCLVTGVVTGADQVGGILGRETAKSTFYNGVGYINNNVFAGRIHASGNAVGGIVGSFRGMNTYNRLANNYFLEGCGASRVVGAVETDLPPMLPFDPLGEGSVELGRAVSADYLAGTEIVEALNSGRYSPGNWVAGGATPVHSPDPVAYRIKPASEPLYVDDRLNMTAADVAGRVEVYWSDGTVTVPESWKGFDIEHCNDKYYYVHYHAATRDYNDNSYHCIQFRERDDPAKPDYPALEGTVYLSVSNDDRYSIADGGDAAGTFMACVPVDLAELSAWVASDEYASLGFDKFVHYADEDAPYRYDITALHLFAYANKLYSSVGAEGLELTGDAGSCYMKNGFFGHDENLNYFVNGVYPVKEGSLDVGATCDEIALSDGDYVDVAMYSDWDFYSDPAAGLHYFVGENGDVARSFVALAGQPLPVGIVRAYSKAISNDGVDGRVPEADYALRWGTRAQFEAWCNGNDEAGIAGVTDAGGNAEIVFSEVGDYVVWAAGGKGSAGYVTADSIVSAPAYATVTVGPPADEATLGRLEAAIDDAASTASAIAASADGTDVPAGTAWATPEAKAAFDEALSAARAVLAGPGTTQRRAEEAIASVGEALSALMAASRDGLKIAPATDEASKVEVGKTYQVGGMSYRVTKVASGNAGGTVALTKAKNAKSVSVPAAVKLADGKSYAVDTIATKAFSNLKKLKKATVGANVKKIEKSAFFKTPKLKKLVVKSKLLKKKASVKGALKGSKAKKLAVKAPKGMKKAYKKSFSKKNLKAPKKVTVK